MCSDRLRPRSGASSSQQRVLALSRESTAPESSTHEPLLPWAPRSTSTGCVSMLRQTPRPRPCCNCMLLHARILVPIRRWSHLLIRPGSSPRSVRISDIKQHVMCSRECICLAKVLRNWRFSPCAAVQVRCAAVPTRLHAITCQVAGIQSHCAAVCLEQCVSSSRWVWLFAPD